MKRRTAFLVFALVVGLFFSRPAVAAPINFLVQGADSSYWSAGIYDSSTLIKQAGAGGYSELFDFGIGWDADSGVAKFEIRKNGLGGFVTWDTDLDGQIPGLINLVARDNTNKFGYEISLYFYGNPVSLSSNIPDKPGVTTGTLYSGFGISAGDLSDLWLTGSFKLLEEEFNIAGPGDTLWWQVSMDSFRPVPIPGAALLLGTGLIAIVAIRRRR